MASNTNTRVIFVQYMNPGAYPPLVHAAHILGEAGSNVLFLGVSQPATRDLVVGSHPRIRVRLMAASPKGLLLKVHYAFWLLWTTITSLLWRADIVYASDPLGAPAGLLAALLGKRVIYHEHDAPPAQGVGLTSLMRLVLAARRQLAKRASLCVFPGQKRLALFRSAARPSAPLISVMNCPRRNEVVARRSSKRFESSTIALHYHGSLAPDRLPLTIVSALQLLPAEVVLQVIGYNAVGFENYSDEIVEFATKLGVAERVFVLGPVSSRDRMLMLAAEARIGLLLMQGSRFDPNFETMTGASNKLFEYYAAGLAVLVSEASGLRDAVLNTRTGLACDEKDVHALVRSIHSLSDLPQSRLVGERGQQLILGDWNYETQFGPVEKFILNRPDGRDRIRRME